MKKIFLSLIAFLTLPTLAFSNICSQIESEYSDLIQQEKNFANDAISISASPEEQAAAWNTFLMRKTILKSEMDATLSASGCEEETQSTQCHERLESVATSARAKGKGPREVLELVRSEAHDKGCHLGIVAASRDGEKFLAGNPTSPTMELSIASKLDQTK